MNKPKQLSFSIIYAFYTGIMPLIMSSFAIYWIFNHVDFLKEIGLINLIVLWFVASISMGFSLIPTSFIALVSGYFWGIKSIPFLIISYILATIIGYLLSKKIDNEQVLAEITKKEKVKSILINLKTEEFKIIALARLSPVFPFGISNVVFTYLGVSLQKLIFAGIIGMLPRSLLMVWAASNSENMSTIFESKWQNYLYSPVFWIGLVSIILLGIVILKAVKKEKQ